MPAGTVTKDARPDVRLSISTEDEVATLLIEGELDLASRGRVTNALSDVGDRDVCLDLSACTFVDSSGLLVLVQTAERLTQEGRSLSVRGVNGDVARVFEVAHLLAPGSAIRLADSEGTSDR